MGCNRFHFVGAVVVIIAVLVIFIVVVVGITVAVGGGDIGIIFVVGGDVGIIVAAFGTGVGGVVVGSLVAVGGGGDVVVAVVAGNMTGNFYFRTADFFSLVVSHQASEKLCSTVFHRKWMIYRILATTEAQLGERR